MNSTSSKDIENLTKENKSLEAKYGELESLETEIR